MAKKRKPRKLNARASSTYITTAALIAAVVLGVVIAGKPQVSQSKTEETVMVTSDYDTVLLPTPSRAIARGEKLSNVEFTYVKWPKEQVRADYLSDLSSSESLVAKRSLPKLLPVPISELSTGSVDINAVAEGIPGGMRAITVRVNMESAIEGWALPGNYVDVIVIRANDSKGKGLEANIIAENVRILSAGRSTEVVNAPSSAPKAPTTVTLLVSQEDALKIKTAESFGKLTFAMRGVGDSNPVSVKSVNQKSIMGGSKRTGTLDSFNGYAKGPNGKTYVLSNSSKWLRANEKLAKKAASVNHEAPSEQADARAQLESVVSEHE